MSCEIMSPQQPLSVLQCELQQCELHQHQHGHNVLLQREGTPLHILYTQLLRRGARPRRFRAGERTDEERMLGGREEVWTETITQKIRGSTSAFDSINYWNDPGAKERIQTGCCSLLCVSIISKVISALLCGLHEPRGHRRRTTALVSRCDWSFLHGCRGGELPDLHGDLRTLV